MVDAKDGEMAMFKHLYALSEGDQQATIRGYSPLQTRIHKVGLLRRVLEKLDNNIVFLEHMHGMGNNDHYDWGAIDGTFEGQQLCLNRIVDLSWRAAQLEVKIDSEALQAAPPTAPVGTP